MFSVDSGEDANSRCQGRITCRNTDTRGFTRGCMVDIMSVYILDVMLSSTAVALSILEVQNREVEFHQCLLETASGVAVLTR